jgi:hypothetical protein
MHDDRSIPQDELDDPEDLDAAVAGDDQTDPDTTDLPPEPGDADTWTITP